MVHRVEPDPIEGLPGTVPAIASAVAPQMLGSSTLARAVDLGRSSNAWKTKPIICS